MNAEQSSIINILILLLIILTSIRLIKYLNNLDEVYGVVEKFNEEIKENGMVKEKVKTVFGTPTNWDIKNFDSSYKNTSENAPVVMGDEKVYHYLNTMIVKQNVVNLEKEQLQLFKRMCML